MLELFYNPSYDAITQFISKYHNPVYLSIRYFSENPGFSSGDSSSEYDKQAEYVRLELGGYYYHAVMAIGYSTIRYAGRYIITRFNHTAKSGEYYIKETDINPFKPIIYISK